MLAADVAFETYAGNVLNQGETMNNLPQPSGTDSQLGSIVGHQPAPADNGTVTSANLDARPHLSRAHEAVLDEIFQSGDAILSASDVVVTDGSLLSLLEHRNSST